MSIPTHVLRAHLRGAPRACALYSGSMRTRTQAAEKARRTRAAGRAQQWAVRGKYELDKQWNAWPRRGVLLRTAPRDCMTEPETGCSGTYPVQGVLYLKYHVCALLGCFGEYSENIPCHHASPLQSLLVPRLRSPSSDGETTVPSLLIEQQADEQEPLSIVERCCTVDGPTVSYWDTLLGKMPRQ